MTLQTLRLELSNPLDDKWLGNCSICKWELWSSGEWAIVTLTTAWEAHSAQKHGTATGQGRMA